MALFVSFLGEIYPWLLRGERTPASHPDFLELERAARERTRRTSTRWTIPEAARPGDRCLVYHKSPLSAFVASADVVGEPKLERHGYWRGHYMAPIGSVRLLPRSVPLSELRRAFPEWGWLRAPRRAVRVPDALASRLARYVGDRGGRLRAAAEVSAIEGLTTETVRFTRSRSRALREQVLRAAAGRCQCCGQDFGALQWTGMRAPLHVHHRRQLALSDAPRTTTLRDLVVLCANCHTLVHSDPRKALPIATVKRYLFSTSKVRRRN